MANNKYRDEWNKLYAHMKTVIKEDSKKPKRFVHNYVDLFVESARASPYLVGHVYAILFLILILVILFT